MMGGGDFKAGEGLDFMEGFPGIGEIDEAVPTLDDTLINKDNDTTNLSEMGPPITPGGVVVDETMEPMGDGIQDISVIPGPNQVRISPNFI